MTAAELIEQIQKDAGEWLEMTKDPAAMVAGILAQKVIKLEDHIKYLEKRLQCQQHAKNYN